MKTNSSSFQSRPSQSCRVGYQQLFSVLTSKNFWLIGLLVVQGKLAKSRLTFEVADEPIEAYGMHGRGIPLPLLHVCIRLVAFRIPRHTLTSMSIHSPVRVVITSLDGESVRRSLSYGLILRKFRYRRGRIHSLSEQHSSVYVRQSVKNRLYVTVRPVNRTDSIALSPRIALARIISIFYPQGGILLYEKNASRYEEGASIVFERLVDMGCRDVKFVLKKSEISVVPECYRQHVVARFSFSHFLCLFSARALVGTEVPAHAAELRTANRILLRFLNSQTFTFVHLQHGVMYMISLDSEARRMVRQGRDFPLSTKVVCSSQVEADHFIESADFPREDLYVAGLPKFDRAFRESDAGRIFIMLTWRPWEYNAIRKDILGTTYGCALLDMLDAIPGHLRDRVSLLPHPLVRDAFLGTETESLIWSDGSYDEALRQCALLITDYSSIAYDAFYRGANIVFWWKEKDECMEHYGGRLMIDENTAFGPVCYTCKDLHHAVMDGYKTPQREEYISRFKRIVEFSDGRNTERVIEALERDGLIMLPQVSAS